MAYMYTISSLTNVSWRGVVIFIVLTMYSKVNGTKFFFMLDLNGLHHIYGKKNRFILFDSMENTSYNVRCTFDHHKWLGKGGIAGVFDVYF